MDVEQRLEKLEREIRGYRRWRLLGIATSGLLVVVALVVKALSSELVLDNLVIQDSQGRARIVLATSPEGHAVVYHRDANGNQRLEVGTWRNGEAGGKHRDANGKIRIDARTFPDGEAVVSQSDPNGNQRIYAGTDSDGMAWVLHDDVIPSF